MHYGADRNFSFFLRIFTMHPDIRRISKFMKFYPSDLELIYFQIDLIKQTFKNCELNLHGVFITLR